MRHTGERPRLRSVRGTAYFDAARTHAFVPSPSRGELEMLVSASSKPTPITQLDVQCAILCRTRCGDDQILALLPLRNHTDRDEPSSVRTGEPSDEARRERC